MDSRRPGGQWIAVLSAVIGLVLVTGCSEGGSGGANGGHRPTTAAGLPTAPPAGPMLCGMVPRASVATALHEPAGSIKATGALTRVKPTGHVKGQCQIGSASGGGPALSVEVLWPSASQAAGVQSLIGTGTPYTFPSSYAPGVGYYNGPANDVASQAVASVVWGDYVVSATDNAPGPGRDALEDSVGLVHQVITALKLSKTTASTS